jgi:phosphatidylglycerophosphate synthase
MIISAAAARWPPVALLVGAILVVILVQLQMLLDCCDGEVARWRQNLLAGWGVPRSSGALHR